MAKKVDYKDEQRFEADFRKRQSEIQAEISISLQSEQFRARVCELSKSVINDHDTLVGLSKKFFENGVFMDNSREFIRKELESTNHKTVSQRFRKILWTFLVAASGGLATFFAEVLLSKIKN